MSGISNVGVVSLCMPKAHPRRSWSQSPAHLALAAQDRVAEGTDERTARQAALKEFGNVTLTTEAARRVWMPSWLEALHDQVTDVRYAIRSLSKHPVFSLTVVAVLALGIGLNAAVFTMLKSMALSPLAGVDGSARLTVMFGETTIGRDVAVSYSDYRYLRDHNRAFSGLLGLRVITANLGRGRSTRPIFAEVVSGNYFFWLVRGWQRGASRRHVARIPASMPAT